MDRELHWNALVVAVACTGALARAQTTQRVSLSTSGTQADAASHSRSISADGRFVAFQSIATNLVPADPYGWDVFVRDLRSGATELVSVATSGAHGDAGSESGILSADGRFVAFVSAATNLVAGDTNALTDAFVRDRQSGTTERVSVGTGGAQSNGNAEGVTMSADGRFVAFFGLATNLVPGDTNQTWDVFVHDRRSGTTERVSVDSAGTQGNAFSGVPSISGNGRFVAFLSEATNLVPGDTNARMDVFVRDRQSGTTQRVNVSTSGAQSNASAENCSISADGRFVTFSSYANNLVAGDTNGLTDAFVHDRSTGSTEIVSLATSGAQGNNHSYTSSISPDGRFVAFTSLASNLVPGDIGYYDSFIRDRQSGITERLSVATSGAQGNGDSYPAWVSADGVMVAFTSNASNLVAGDTNNSWDVFVRDRAGPPPAATPFCFGDGSGTPCYCGDGAPGHGCPNSENPLGANLAASGASSITADTLVMWGSGMPDGSAVYFQGTTRVAAGAGVVFGEGLLCAGGSIIRLGTTSNAGGASQYPPVGGPPVSATGTVTTPGLRTYQLWYRNSALFCKPSSFNLTNGLEVSWTL